MKRKLFSDSVGLLLVAATLTGCAPVRSDWITLIDGESGLDNFNRIGDANWRAEDGAIVGDQGVGHLVSKDSYTDFEIRAEFWADHTTNSGIFIRASDPSRIGAENAYEVNIYDQRPVRKYATGAIVNFVPTPVPSPYKAGGKWNSMEIRARGPEVTAMFNGTETAHLRDTTYASGPFSLQLSDGPLGITTGAIKWRKVQIRPL